MALDKSTLKTAIESAFNTLWSDAAATALKAEILAGFNTAFNITDPTQAAAARQACADAIGAAVVKYVHGADGAKVTALATSMSNAMDTFVKGATITIGLTDAGLQVTTGLGAPTGAPLAPVTLNGAVS